VHLALIIATAFLVSPPAFLFNSVFAGSPTWDRDQREAAPGRKIEHVSRRCLWLVIDGW
jgi:hypothetical protein